METKVIKKGSVTVRMLKDTRFFKKDAETVVSEELAAKFVTAGIAERVVEKAKAVATEPKKEAKPEPKK